MSKCLASFFMLFSLLVVTTCALAESPTRIFQNPHVISMPSLNTAEICQNNGGRWEGASCRLAVVDQVTVETKQDQKPVVGVITYGDDKVTCQFKSDRAYMQDSRSLIAKESVVMMNEDHDVQDAYCDLQIDWKGDSRFISVGADPQKCANLCGPGGSLNLSRAALVGGAGN